MPIEFTRRDIDLARVKPARTNPDRMSRTGQLILPLIETAFREYAKAHNGCDKLMEDREWSRFLQRLSRYL